MFRPEFDRVVLVPNPSSVPLAEAAQDEIEYSGLNKPVHIVPTRYGGVPPNADHFARELEKGDLVAMYCGDGTAATIIGALMMAKLAESIPVGSLGGGYSRDIGRATQRHPNGRPSKFLMRCIARQSYMLESTVATPDGGTQRYQAASYMGWGKSVKGAREIDSPNFRERQGLLSDARVGIRTLGSPDTIEIVDAEGDQRVLGDITVSKGPSIAKVGRPPIKQWDKRMWIAETKPGTAQAWFTFGGLVLGSSRPEFGKYQDKYSFTAVSQVPFHFDGEVNHPRTGNMLDILAGSQVSVGLGDQPYWLLTDRVELV